MVGAETAQRSSSIRKVFAVLRVDLLFLFVIVFAMTVKPTGDDVGIVRVVAAILVAGTLFFLRDVVRARPAPAR